MDVKKLASFILLSGLAVFLYGLVVIAANQPITGTPNTGDAIRDINIAISNLDRNFGRKYKRENAKKFLLYGGIILFAGVAVRLSSKGRDSAVMDGNNSTHAISGEVRAENSEFLFCTQCGMKNSSKAAFCKGCGSSMSE